MARPEADNRVKENTDRNWRCEKVTVRITLRPLSKQSRSPKTYLTLPKPSVVGRARTALPNCRDLNSDKGLRLRQLKSAFCGVWVLRLSFSGTISPPISNG